jgi:uncharacterized protein
MKKLFIPKNLVALLAGLFFALGLVLSGMTQPAKVIGFLNIGGIFEGSFPGKWDPTLAFVMGGALLVTLIAFTITPRHGRQPWFANKFELPTRKDIDIKLVGGAAFASLYAGGLDIVIFMTALIAGMYIATRLSKR